MHFWINKGNQQGHYWPRSCRLVRPPPEAVANYLASRPRGFYPNPMVTPVRRFQSLESVSNNGLRYSRTSPGHRPIRPAVHSNAHIYYNSTINRTPRFEQERSIDIEDQAAVQTLGGSELESYIQKFKFALLSFAFLSVCVMFGANYVSTGHIWRLGVETLVVISGTLVILLLGGIIILYLGDKQNTTHLTMIHQQSFETSNDQFQLDDLQDHSHQQRPTQLSIHETEMREASPPPYHIAIRLTNQVDLEEIQIYDDQSPPPPYEKAVT
ncbi:uncharacterized protein [Euwallacea similis]|uniref:uncharacterized protein n=1 Tax=Euwallacea similis TaxID=1736056 RepID=UPI00344D58F3